VSGIRGSKIDRPVRPFVVGLTGSFGTGKSTVAWLLGQRGARVIDADRVAHEVFRKENRIHGKLQSLFPELGGNMNRAKVARIVFRDSKKRRALERLIHPYIFARIQEEILKTAKPILVVEVPLLFESGFHRHTDWNGVVKAGEKVVTRRLRRRGFTAGEVEARWRAQMPLSGKIRKADFVIDNSQGLERTRAQVIQVWNQIERSLLTHAQRKRKQSFREKG